MHILATSSTTFDDMVEPIDLRQPAGEMAILSFADSDLAALAAAWSSEQDMLPSLRLAHLRDLRHPMSVDLWIDRVGQHAKIILVRLLGGLDWWNYGVERLAALARERNIVLAVLPGEDRDDPRLADFSTLSQDELTTLLRFFREGGRDNLRALLRRLARYAGMELDACEPHVVPRVTAYLPREGIIGLDRLQQHLFPGKPVAAIIVYRSILLAADTAPIDALCEALNERGIMPAPLVINSLKDKISADFIRTSLAQLNPAIVIATTAFAASGEPGAPTPLDELGVPVLQAIMATTKRTAWHESPRGLGAADLAMHVVLPELDGRVLAGVLSFKHPLPQHEALAFTALANRPEPDRIAQVAERVAALIRLQQTSRGERKVAVLMPNYPGSPGRDGYAVGLDVPASTIALLHDLSQAGYRIGQAPQDSRTLLDAVRAGSATTHLTVRDYEKYLHSLPDAIASNITQAWGHPIDDPDVHDGAFRFHARAYGNVFIAFAPDRGRSNQRRADYHDPALPPRHALVAFGLWLRHVAKVDAIIHMGAHGTLEWLPGKAVALTQSCFPEAVVGPVPVIYPFIVSNPGEAAQAKRRLAAVTIGHLSPPLVTTGLSGETRELERLIDEFSQADGLDRRRRQRLSQAIIETAERIGLTAELGTPANTDADDTLRRIDAWLCDIKELAVKDGLHIYARVPEAKTSDKPWAMSGETERIAILTALDGRHVGPGPAGSPSRGRRDVLPTGRNLFTADPRTLPTPTAMDLGALAAEEVIRTYLQRHGDMPRALVIDLWGSATLRTGGEEIAQGLALMGCRPAWDQATGRVTGIQVLPTATMGRARVDVTWRISGLFRDLFPAQIALLNAATQAVAAREEPGDQNPLRQAHQTSGKRDKAALARIFGTAPGAYGAGIEDLFGHETDRDQFGAAYLAAASHTFTGEDSTATPMPGAFATRVAAADLLLHASDDPGRDLLEGSADAAFVGGFAAAAKSMQHVPDLVMLDVTDPARPRARMLDAALARIVRGRATNPRFIEGQMRHGPRGAAEFVETVDRLIAFAETTDAVPGALFDLIHDAYLGDPRVREFLLRENPAAAQEIASRLTGARRNGLWHPRRNDVDAELSAITQRVRP